MGIINPAFIERLNLTIWDGVSKLARRNWGLAQYHEELRELLSEPKLEKGRQAPRKYRQRTPAMAAGLVSRRWTVMELFSYPLL